MLDYFEYCKKYFDGEKEIEMKKFPSPFDLVSTTECVAPAVVCKIDCCEDMPLKKKEQTMACETDTQVQRRYFFDRLMNAGYVKLDELAKMFHLYDSTKPTSYKELIDWIKNDKFTLDTKVTAKIDVDIENNNFYCSPFDGIVWNGRGFINDFDGYAAAKAGMDKARTSAKDTIMSAATGADMAKAVADFEAWTPTPATTTAAS